MAFHGPDFQEPSPIIAGWPVENTVIVVSNVMFERKEMNSNPSLLPAHMGP